MLWLIKVPFLTTLGSGEHNTFAIRFHKIFGQGY